MLLFELFSQPGYKTLYVCRQLLNTQDIIDWARSQGLTSILPANKLHVTIAFSKEKVDWSKTKPDMKNLAVKGGGRSIKYLGDSASPALVLRFDSDALHERWADFIENLDCSWDYENYQPHLTLSFAQKKINPKTIEPYTGELIFGPERFKEVDTSWKEKIEEMALT